MTDRFVTIHGHFYQPPRENPWLEAVPRQPSAAPYHDWNERIAAECYAPNASARILENGGLVSRVVNNYERISFNVGPTLLSWLEANDPDTYAAILAADRRSAGRFGGHGSALAQVYNHMILPLANERDRRTQVRWGVSDFERRFGRAPEGMWLPETAVDVPTLEALAEAGIRFTILAPHQAARWRPAGEEGWRELEGDEIDTRRPYLQRLPSGRSIALFFYAGPTSRAIAFEGLLEDGAAFAGRLTELLGEATGGPRLAHVATDGETYGHHHAHGEMALAFALREIERDADVRLTDYGEFLELCPPAHEVEVREATSWSCVHGIERWRADCGCATGAHPEWSQAWRGPLRAALDWLRDAVAGPWEAAAGELLSDPWAARDAYVDVVLDRSDASLERFFADHAAGALDRPARVRALRLLELQRHALLMYTSCGWFFDDLAGTEAVQVIEYAARAVQLAGDLLDDGFEAGFVERLAAARSNVEEEGDGRTVYERRVGPARVDLARIAAHYAVAGLAAPHPDTARVYGYAVERLEERRGEDGGARLALGRARVTSVVTRHAAEYDWAVLLPEDGEPAGRVRPRAGGWEALARGIAERFQDGDHAGLLRLVDERFDGPVCTGDSLLAQGTPPTIERPPVPW